MSGSTAAPDFRPGASPAVIFAVFGALALAAAALACVIAVRRRDPLPVAACVGALVCALNEPIYDVLGKLVYARVPPRYVAYTAFGRHIPWSLVLGYLPWVGLVPVVLARAMEKGLSTRRLYAIAAALMTSVGLLEILNALWLHDWRYYAPESGRGVLAGGIIQMASMPILCAFMLRAFAGPLRGIRRVLAAIAIPTMALPMVFAATSWPIYVTNYADVSETVRWLGAAAAIAFCVLAVVAVVRVAAWNTAPGSSRIG